MLLLFCAVAFPEFRFPDVVVIAESLLFWLKAVAVQVEGRRTVTRR